VFSAIGANIGNSVQQGFNLGPCHVGRVAGSAVHEAVAGFKRGIYGLPVLNHFGQGLGRRQVAQFVAPKVSVPVQAIDLDQIVPYDLIGAPA
jgi:hypothetical protein